MYQPRTLFLQLVFNSEAACCHRARQRSRPPEKFLSRQFDLDFLLLNERAFLPSKHSPLDFVVEARGRACFEGGGGVTSAMHIWALSFPRRTQASSYTTYAVLNTLQQLANSQKDNTCAAPSSYLTFA